MFTRGAADEFHTLNTGRFYWSKKGNAPAHAEYFLKMGRLYFLKRPPHGVRNRFSDDDIVMGPLTVAQTSGSKLSLSLRSAENEDGEARCSITGYAFGYGFRLYVPQIVKPVLEKTKAHWDEETIKRMGRDWYATYHRREFGFSLYDGHLSVYYGQQNRNGWGGNMINRRKSMFLPWTQWTHVRHSYYDVQGDLFYEERRDYPEVRLEAYEVRNKCPAAYFLIRDYDGKEIVARTIMEEREWHKGEKSFAWLKYFTKPMIRTILDINFAEEVGTGKGSWKGGLCGTSIDLEGNEMHEAAFRRYCEKLHNQKEGRYKITFLRVVDPSELIHLVPTKCSW